MVSSFIAVGSLTNKKGPEVNRFLKIKYDKISNSSGSFPIPKLIKFKKVTKSIEFVKFLYATKKFKTNFNAIFSQLVGESKLAY